VDKVPVTETAVTGQLRHNNRDRTEEDCQDSTSRARKRGQDSQNMIARTGYLGQGYQKKHLGQGPPGWDNCGKTVLRV
jgi:hypothetical protein